MPIIYSCHSSGQSFHFSWPTNRCRFFGQIVESMQMMMPPTRTSTRRKISKIIYTFTWRTTFVRRVPEVWNNQAQMLYGIVNYVTELLIIFFRYRLGTWQSIMHMPWGATARIGRQTLCPLNSPNI
jgi:hypothetical protein